MNVNAGHGFSQTQHTLCVTASYIKIDKTRMNVNAGHGFSQTQHTLCVTASLTAELDYSRARI